MSALRRRWRAMRYEAVIDRSDGDADIYLDVDRMSDGRWSWAAEWFHGYLRGTARTLRGAQRAAERAGLQQKAGRHG